MNSEEGSKPQA